MRRAWIPLLAVVLVLASVTGASAAPGSGMRSAVARLDHRIADARRNLHGWHAWLSRWSDQVDAAERAVWVRADEVRLLPTPNETDGILRSGTTVATLVATSVLRSSRAHLRGVLHDPEARVALQQAFAWEDYLGELQGARHDLLAGGPGATVAIPGGPPTFDVWARMLLQRIGAPACGENRIAVVAWEAAESTAAAFNPLATTRGESGSSAMNGVGVQNYVSLDEGLWATVDTLASGATGYTDIVDSLQACAPAELTVDAINASAWCAGCAHGTYVTDLVDLIRADYAGYADRLIATAPVSPAAGVTG
jgi:hypothetical protein